MIKLVWVVAILGPQGIMSVTIPETTKFKTVDECAIFGKAMTPRLQDWVRGGLGADWDLQVAVRFNCGPEGSPA